MISSQILQSVGVVLRSASSSEGGETELIDNNQDNNLDTSDSISVVSPDPPPLSRPYRESRRPSKYQDFDLNDMPDLQMPNLNRMCFVEALVAETNSCFLEPKTIKEALNSVDADHWKESISETILGHVKNTTWDIVDKPQNKNIANYTEKIPYQAAVGSLLYAAQATRPDIGHSVNLACKFCNNPDRTHWTFVKRIMRRYMKGTAETTLNYSKERGTCIIGYCDSNYGGDVGDRRSTTGYVFLLGGGAVLLMMRLHCKVC
ncbi:hypothetical protein JTE90_008456 [Oedothorax gibbosus]|uniref:Retrovirus-related Pol polyprotein from transposon TNT 1-94 n=1 Tax=Oedothorax gibbosus TaxID=931172 RepID=A0AAV6UZ10_9ARAC|nr:hypothetical protein JTE90_008456 [Oedothorax gibbosus]